MLSDLTGSPTCADRSYYARADEDPGPRARPGRRVPCSFFREVPQTFRGKVRAHGNESLAVRSRASASTPAEVGHEREHPAALRDRRGALDRVDDGEPSGAGTATRRDTVAGLRCRG